MYIPVKVHGLSKPQISRLLNQHGVKIKLGGSLVVHVSKEQHKKLNKAHLKGGAVVLHFDPFQISQHQHLRGRGTQIMDQSFTGNDVAHFIGANESSEPLMNKEISLNQVKDAGKRVKNFLGLGVKQRGRPKKININSSDAIVDLSGGKIRKPKALRDLEKIFKPIASKIIHQGIPAVAGVMGGIAGAEFGPIGSIAGAAAAKLAAEDASDKLGKISGLGLKKRRGRPSKVGVGMGQAHHKKSHGKKKAGRPRKGSALKPAGY